MSSVGKAKSVENAKEDQSYGKAVGGKLKLKGLTIKKKKLKGKKG